MTRSPLRVSLVLLAALAALGGTVAPTWAVGVDPIQPGNRPLALAGMTNGGLPPSATYVQGPRCSIALQAAGSFVEMVAAARADGVGLGPEECYRDYAGQVYWRTWWCDQGVCGNAAVPGTSNHGWGKAVDLRDTGGELTWTSAGYHWMVQNAGRFGFNHPGGVDEAWHWEWVGDGGTLHGWPVRPDLWPAPVRGAIAVEWTDRGGTAALGYALTSERTTPDGTGRYNHFDRGSVYWSPASGAHEVHGAIGGRWTALGGVGSALGYPTGDERAVPGGRSSTFQHGTITWDAATGAVTVSA